MSPPPTDRPPTDRPPTERPAADRLRLDGLRIERLRIDRLRIDQFGGLRDLTLELGEGLVVLHGPNESGKTTLATLLSWLLVGPTGTTAEALRFGRPGDRVGGRIDGRLGEQEVRSEAGFRLLQRGLPNTSALSITVAGTAMDLDQWRRRLGGIDGHVHDATYRMWGATLHESDEILGEIAQVALAGLTGSRRVHEIAEQLERGGKQRLTSSAQGADSWQQLQRRITEAEGEIRRIASGAGEYRQAQDRLRELNGSIETARRELTERSARAASLDLIASVAAERRAATEAAVRLAELDQVPERWLPIITDVDGLANAIDRVENSVTNLERIDSEVHRALAAVALDHVDDRLAVTHQVVTNVQVAQTELRQARDRHDEAIARYQEAEHAADEAIGAARAALAGCPELDGRAIDELRIGEAERADLHLAIEQWRTAENEASLAEEAVATQIGRLDQVEHHARVSRDAWDRFGTGRTAQQWQAAPRSPASRSTDRSLWAVGASTALALVVAIGAVLVLPRPAAAVASAAAIALVGAMTAVLTLRPADVDAGADTAGRSAPLLAAANEVIAADAAVDHECRELGRLESELRQRRDRIERCEQRVSAVCTGLGIAAAGSAEATSRMMARIDAAVAATSRADLARRALTEAGAIVDRSAVAVDERIAVIRSILGQAGVPDRMSWHDAADQIEGLRLVTELRTEQRITLAELHAARDDLDGMLAPLGEDAHPDHPRLDLARARELRALQHERSEIEQARDDALRTITARLRDDPEARAVLGADPTGTELDAERAAVRADCERVQAQIDELIDERGQLTEQMARLEAADELTAARLATGELRTRAEEQLWQAAVRLVARSMLRRAAAERRRTHQPALVERASDLLRSVAPERGQILIDPDEAGSAEISLLDPSGSELTADRLSTGMRALTLLALRLATAELDGERRGVRIPIICDDPLVHLDDQRAAAVLPLLARAAADGHQVILLTCHGRTVDAAAANGARVITLGGTA